MCLRLTFLTALVNAGLALGNDASKPPESVELAASLPIPSRQSLSSLLLAGPGVRSGLNSMSSRSVSPRLAARTNRHPFLEFNSLFPRRPAPNTALVPSRRSRVALEADSKPAAPKKVDEKLWVVAAFAFLAGLTDTAISCRYDLFACRMTGNAANLLRTLTPGGPPLGDFAFMVGFVSQFILGSALYRFLDLKLKHRSAKSVLAPVVFSTLALHDVFSGSVVSRWPQLFLPLAMGIVTAISTAVTGAVTFVMSGHLLKVGSSVAEYFATGLNAAGKSALRKSSVALIAFILGAGANSFSHTIPTPFFTTLGAAYAFLLVLYARIYEKASTSVKAGGVSS